MKRLAWSALLVLVASAPAGAGVASVWAVGDGEKVPPDAVASPLAHGNAAWDGRTVRLFGARNEVVAFQVIVQADAAGIGALSASLPELRQRGGCGAHRLPAARGRPLALGRAADPALLRALDEGDGGDARLVGVAARQRRGAEAHRRLAAGAARARRTRARAAAASR